MLSTKTFQRLDENNPPVRPVVVTIDRLNGKVQGEIDRQLLVVGGSVCLPEHQGPMNVPDALTAAEQIAAELKHVGGSGVFIKLADAKLWDQHWGKLQ